MKKNLVLLTNVTLLLIKDKVSQESKTVFAWKLSSVAKPFRGDTVRSMGDLWLKSLKSVIANKMLQS